MPEDGVSGEGYLEDERWAALRRIGESAGWHIDPREV